MRMVAKPKPEDKWMLLLFPLITLSLFIVAVLLFHYLPIVLPEVSRFLSRFIPGMS